MICKMDDLFFVANLLYIDVAQQVVCVNFTKESKT